IYSQTVAASRVKATMRLGFAQERCRGFLADYPVGSAWLPPMKAGDAPTSAPGATTELNGNAGEPVMRGPSGIMPSRGRIVFSPHAPSRHLIVLAELGKEPAVS